jgi:hypothetical protein
MVIRNSKSEDLEFEFTTVTNDHGDIPLFAIPFRSFYLFMTYYWDFDQSNMMGGTCGAGTVYPS